MGDMRLRLEIRVLDGTVSTVGTIGSAWAPWF